MRTHARAYLCGSDLNPDEARRRAAASNGGRLIQAVAECSASNEFFVEVIAAQTMRAQASGTLLARKPEVDLLLRLAGTTQISKAIREKGAKAGEPFMLVVAGSTKPKPVEGVRCRKLPRRGLSAEELRRVEAAALLNAERA